MERLIRVLRDFIEVPSVSGEEGDFGDRVARELSSLGLAVERQRVSENRFNVLARAGEPEVVLCTHLDTVPPFFPSRVDSDFVHGRGACDAKGQIVAMLAAVERLLARGEDRIGLLFTVGEELASDGAAHADRALAPPWRPRWIVVGEPTSGRFVGAHKGVYKARLLAHGVAGHSSQAGGPSAIHELVVSIARLLEEDWGSHPLLGSGTLNIGTVRGGVAPNVIAETAEAEILVRAVERPGAIEARVRACLSPHVELELPYKTYGPVEFHVPEGETGDAAAFGTDAPHLPHWGRPLLYGCGSILDAHTDHEKLGKQELAACIERHITLAEELLARSEVGR
jgi:acetylornithine deacetylase